MQVYLETERMIMREFTEADVDNLLQLDSDPEVMRYINGGKATPREFIVDKVMPRILSYYEELEDQGLWAVINKGSDEFMGWFHLRPNRVVESETELGYRLKQKYWNQGYATEGSRSLLEKGFKQLQVEVIVAIADPANGASRRVMEKVGLRHEKEYTESDGFVVAKYRLDRSDYS